MSLSPSIVVPASSPSVEPYPSAASPPLPSPKYRAVYPEVIQRLDFKIMETPSPVLYAPPPMREDGSYPPCDVLRRNLPTTTMDDAKPGHDVKFHGLQGDVKHWNGTTGTLVKYLEQEAHWMVRRSGELEIVTVEPDNLEPLTVNNNQPSWNDVVGFRVFRVGGTAYLFIRGSMMSSVPVNAIIIVAGAVGFGVGVPAYLLVLGALAVAPLPSWNNVVGFGVSTAYLLVLNNPLAALRVLALVPLRVWLIAAFAVAPLWLMWTVGLVHISFYSLSVFSPSTEPHPSEESTPPPPPPPPPQHEELPKGVRLHILDYLSNEDKMEASRLGQQPYRDCHVSNGLERPIITTCLFSADENNTVDAKRGIRLLQQLGRTQKRNPRKKQTLQNHHRIKVENVHRFGTVGASYECLCFLGLNATMVGVTALDMSVATQQTVNVPHDFVGALVIMLPNLRVLNLTNIAYDIRFLKMNLAVTCPSLEKIVWNNGRNDALVGPLVREEEFKEVLFNSISAEGDILVDCPNLKEIEMNNCRFNFINNRDLDVWSNDPNKFLFHHCSENLERVSIKNATTIGIDTNTPIPQAELVKFVRKVPSLRYFSSDLTPDNIAMLQQERSDIVFE